MNRPTTFTDDDLESLLRATFAAEAHGRVPDARAIPPYPDTERLATVHPLRRRWTGIVLVAAALVAVLVGALVVGDQVMNSQRPPVPAGTSMAPEPTVTPTVASSVPTPTPTTTKVATSGSNPPAPTTKQITVQGVGLTVPVSWNAVTLATGAEGDTCLTTASARDHGVHADNCELHVMVAGLAAGIPKVDVPGVYGESGICSSSPPTPQQTVTADEITVDGQTAEHRVFTAPCVPEMIEQWTIVTAPVVIFYRSPEVADAGAREVATDVVRSAVLPGPRSPLRLADHGLLVGLDGSALRIDRVVDRYGAPVLNNNPATYDYPFTADTDIRFGDAQGEIIGMNLARLQQLENGPLVIDGVAVPKLSDMTVTVYTDGVRATEVGLSPR